MISDAQLVLRARGGDQRAFETLLARHEDVIGFLRQWFFDLPGGDGDDLDQEARLGLLKAVRDYRPSVGVSFRSFITSYRLKLLSALRAWNTPIRQDQ